MENGIYESSNTEKVIENIKLGMGDACELRWRTRLRIRNTWRGWPQPVDPYCFQLQVCANEDVVLSFNLWIWRVSKNPDRSKKRSKRQKKLPSTRLQWHDVRLMLRYWVAFRRRSGLLFAAIACIQHTDSQRPGNKGLVDLKRIVRYSTEYWSLGYHVRRTTSRGEYLDPRFVSQSVFQYLCSSQEALIKCVVSSKKRSRAKNQERRIRQRPADTEKATTWTTAPNCRLDFQASNSPTWMFPVCNVADIAIHLDKLDRYHQPVPYQIDTVGHVAETCISFLFSCSPKGK